jgi:hypothetical protein
MNAALPERVMGYPISVTQRANKNRSGTRCVNPIGL